MISNLYHVIFIIVGLIMCSIVDDNNKVYVMIIVDL